MDAESSLKLNLDVLKDSVTARKLSDALKYYIAPHDTNFGINTELIDADDQLNKRSRFR